MRSQPFLSAARFLKSWHKHATMLTFLECSAPRNFSSAEAVAIEIVLDCCCIALDWQTMQSRSFLISHRQIPSSNFHFGEGTGQSHSTTCCAVASLRTEMLTAH